MDYIFKACGHYFQYKLFMLHEHYVELGDDYGEFEIQRAYHNASLASSAFTHYFPPTPVRSTVQYIDYESFLGPIGLWDWVGDSYWDVDRACLCAYISHSRATAETLSRCILRILEPTPELVEIVNHMHYVIRTSWLLQNIRGDNRLISNLEGPQYLVAKLENQIPPFPQCNYTPEQWQEMPPRPDFLYYTKKELETVYRDNCVLIQDHLRMIVSHC